MTTLLVASGPGTGKTSTISALTTYLRATNKDVFRTKHSRLTEEQWNILEWVENNIPVTPETTIVGLSYNRDAAVQLNSRTHKSVECRTHHGWGYKILQTKYGYLKPNPQRNNVLIEKITGQRLSNMRDKFKWLTAARYFDKLKDEQLDPTPTNLEALAQKYEDLAAFKFDTDTPKKITQLIQVAKTPSVAVGIDFIDQVWLPLFMLKKPRFDIAIVDEAQDQSPARFRLAESIATHKIYVGDKDQSINAFAGADPYTIDRIEEVADCVLPLKLSFRCPPRVINKLNALKPKAKLRGLDKDDGVEQRVHINVLGKKVKELEENYPYGSHLMISRYNAPLIKVAYRLLEQDIPCKVLGDRVIKSLLNIIRNRKADSVEELEDKLDSYEKNVCRDAQPYIQEQVRDKIDCIRLVIPYCGTIKEVENSLQALLKPRGKEHVRLATIHKSKGLEAANLWIIFPPIQSDKAVTVEQKLQEENVEYVAESRTSRNTFRVYEE